MDLETKQFWASSYEGDVRNWSDENLKAMVRTSGKGCSDCLTRSELEVAVNSLLDRLSCDVPLQGIAPLESLDPRGFPDFDPSQFEVPPAVQHILGSSDRRAAGPCEYAFNACFSREELDRLKTSSDTMPSGLNPYMDLRINLKCMCQGVDKRIFKLTYQVVEEGTGRLLEGVVLQILRVATVSSHVFLCVIWHAVPIHSGHPAATSLRDFWAGDPLHNKVRVSQRELQVLLRLLDKNRKGLSKKYVKYMENLWNTKRGMMWRASVVTPLRPPETTMESNRHAASELKVDLSCAMCGKSKTIAEQEGSKLRCCQNCLAVWYCSKECQQGNWKAHKKACKRLDTFADCNGTAFRSGDDVEICGLATSVHLNGLRGTLADFCDESGRWVVEVEGHFKKVRPANLKPSMEPARLQNAFLPRPSSSVEYEDPNMFEGISSILIPIEVAAGDLDRMKGFNHQMINGELVELNKLRKNVHGRNVFVIKCQVTTSAAIREQALLRGQDIHHPECQSDGALIYDALRRDIYMEIRSFENEARGKAFESLAKIASQHGGRVNSSQKVYLFGQRDGPALRIFTGRFPPQQQPF